jgi:hypothetical protein
MNSGESAAKSLRRYGELGRGVGATADSHIIVFRIRRFPYLSFPLPADCHVYRQHRSTSALLLNKTNSQ